MIIACEYCATLDLNSAVLGKEEKGYLAFMSKRRSVSRTKNIAWLGRLYDFYYAIAILHNSFIKIVRTRKPCSNLYILWNLFQLFLQHMFARLNIKLPFSANESFFGLYIAHSNNQDG